MISVVQRAAASASHASTSIVKGTLRALSNIVGNDSTETKTERLVVTGGGLLANAILSHAIDRDFQTTICASNAKRYVNFFKLSNAPEGSLTVAIPNPTAEEVKKAHPVNLIDSNLLGKCAKTDEVFKSSIACVIDTPHNEKTLTAEHWKEVFNLHLSDSQDLRVIHTRALCSEDNNQTVVRPTEAVVDGLVLARKENPDSTLILQNPSSDMASDHTFQHDYPNARRKVDKTTEEKCHKHNIYGSTLRANFIEYDRNVKALSAFAGGNHGADPATQVASNLGIAIIVGFPNQQSPLTVQPVTLNDMIEALLTPRAKRKFSTIDAVGPKAYTQEEYIAVCCNRFGIPYIRTLRVPFQLVKKFIDYGLVLAQMRVGPLLLKHRVDNPEANKARCHKPLEDFIGRELQSVEDLPKVDKSIRYTSPLIGVVLKTLQRIYENPTTIGLDIIKSCTKSAPEILGSMVETIKAEK